MMPRSRTFDDGIITKGPITILIQLRFGFIWLRFDYDESNQTYDSTAI